MAKLYLRFENRTIKEVPLTLSGVTIGRLPDNHIQIDNPAVSSHHAKVYWERGDFFVEDNDSLNGTFINDQRIRKRALANNDNILIGKHTLNFQAEPQQTVAAGPSTATKPPVPTLDATAMLDTKKARELMAQSSGKHKISALDITPSAAPVTSYEPKVRVGVLTVMTGKTDEQMYVLTGKLTIIGKSDMASIRLTGWFAPKIAAAINRREDKYFIAPSDGRHKVKVNGSAIDGQWQLNPGDTLAVGSVSMTFDYN